MLFVVDNDDPELTGYMASPIPLPATYQDPAGNMVGALNQAARWAIETLSPKYLGFIGDDHRFRTPGWDRAFTDVLVAKGGGMVYGNDLFRPDGDIPTQIVMSVEIVQALGWMGLPTCTHLYIDNVWRHIGEALSCLYYMPDVVIEHLHPAAGKAEWDEGHRRVNAPEMYGHDAEAFSQWVATSAAGDLKHVRDALGDN
jgi:hypothetical protein